VSRFASSTLLVSMFVSLAAPLRAESTPAVVSPPGGKVFVFGCAVQFSTKSGATSATRPGMLNTDRNRRETSVSMVYQLAGVDSTAYQRLTDEICAGAPAALTAAGFEVVTAGVSDHWAFQQAVEKGGASPDERGIGNVKAVVYAPTGQKVIVPEALGPSAGVTMITSETTVGVALGARPVSLVYTVDFAEVTGERRGRFQDQDMAQVKANLRVTVGLTAVSYDPTESRCSPRGAFGEARNQQACWLKKADTRSDNVYTTTDSTERQFTDPIVSVERTSLGAAGAALTAVNVLSVLGGGGTASYKLFTVTVDPAKYEAAVREGASGLIAPAMKWITEPESRPRRGRR
jgi:hypothetical protein